MLPTPDTSHVSFKNIYEPAEDSYLLLDTLSSEKETVWLRDHFSTGSIPLVVEVGIGSGVVISFVAANAEQILGRPVLGLGIDVNINACLAASRTADLALRDQHSSSVYLGSVNADLCSSLPGGSVDILMFNPPYVPTSELPNLPHLVESHIDEFASDSHLLALSYAGGADGMQTTMRFLNQFPDVLSRRGILYLLLCAQNKPQQVKQFIKTLSNGPWSVETVGTSGKKAGWEKLQILRVWREQ